MTSIMRSCCTGFSRLLFQSVPNLSMRNKSTLAKMPGGLLRFYTNSPAEKNENSSDFFSRNFQPVSPALGAEVKGVDLSKPLDEKTQELIQKGLDEFSALLFRGQNLDGKQMVKVCGFLGPIAKEQHYVDQGLTLEGCPECFVLRNDKENPPLFDFWHCDKSAWKYPIRYNVLSCREIPDIGGDTLISNTRKVFDHMSEGMKKIFREMKGVYNEKNGFEDKADGQGSETNKKIVEYLKNKGFAPKGIYDKFEDQVHPIVRKNPRNNLEALYFSPPYFSFMEDFSREESMHFQKFLLDAIVKPEFVYRHHWKKGDLLIMDNSCTSHYAASDFYPEIREMHRIIITEIPS